jgi:hypothetical protein
MLNLKSKSQIAFRMNTHFENNSTDLEARGGRESSQSVQHSPETRILPPREMFTFISNLGFSEP